MKGKYNQNKQQVIFFHSRFCLMN